MKKEKESSSTESSHPPSKYQAADGFNEFADFAVKDLPVEWTILLKELGSTQSRLREKLMNAGFDPIRAQDAIDANLVAECPQCHIRLSTKTMGKASSAQCATPNCSSNVYTLRWMAVPREQVAGEIYKEL